MEKFRRVLEVIIGIAVLVTGLVALFDPVTAVWMGWGVVFIALFAFGLYLNEEFPGYRSFIWLLLGTVWFVAFFPVDQLSEKLGRPPVEYHGALLPSHADSPPNHCIYSLAGKNPPDTDYLFFGSNVSPENFEGGRMNLIKVKTRCCSP